MFTDEGAVAEPTMYGRLPLATHFILETTLIIYIFILKTTLIIYNFILKTTLIIYIFANFKLDNCRSTIRLHSYRSSYVFTQDKPLFTGLVKVQLSQTSFDQRCQTGGQNHRCAYVWPRI